MEQTLDQRNSSWNVNGTFSLKALANKVLEQNKKGNNPGTTSSISIPPLPQSSIACGTNTEIGCKAETDILDEYERLAIAEYDGSQTFLHAQRIAYLDAFISVLTALPATNSQKDWLDMRIQTALAWIEAQEYRTIN